MMQYEVKCPECKHTVIYGDSLMPIDMWMDARCQRGHCLFKFDPIAIVMYNGKWMNFEEAFQICVQK